jgi:phenylacetate-CoA ligase
MDLSYQRKRLADFARGAKRSRELAERERWPRERLELCQQERLDALVRHAAVHSPYYRDRIGETQWSIDKAELMDNFDAIVTDPRLRRDHLLARAESLAGDAIDYGQYRVMATSGSSGLKGLFVYDRPAWSELVAQFLRYSAMIGVRPRLPRLRVAAIGGASGAHMTRRIAQTANVGLHRIMSLPATLPLARVVDQLNRFQPEFMNVFPSIAVLLADEQLAGRLGFP